MFSALRDAGFQIAFHAHAAAILSVDFPEVAAQLEAILLASTIPIEEIVGSGGGETKGTQRLRRALHEHGWLKHKFEITRSIDGVARESISREVDHIARFERTERNNKVRSSTASSGTTGDGESRPHDRTQHPIVRRRMKRETLLLLAFH